jgi:serine/threonine-protein kinase
MSTVHRAHDERLDRTVALKVMHPHLAADEQFRRRFAREARSAARLSHPHVVQVYDQGQDEDAIYLSMELIEGRTLRAAMAQEGPLVLRDALEITAEVLEALRAAHQAGIVHRDIKPENVLLTPTGSVKVADFGLARAIGTAGSSTTGTLLGTVAYISPEVVTRGHCDARSDLYALGVVLYEMVTGSQPYTGEQPVHIAFQHVHEDIPAPSARVPSVPEQIDSLVTWSAARDPQQRPATAHQMLTAVRGLLRELPAEVLDSAPEVVDEVEADTGGIALLTRDLDDVDLEAPAPVQVFPRPEADPSVPDVLPEEDEEGTLVREVSLRPPRPRRGRHTAGSPHRPSRAVRGLAALLILATAGTGVGLGTDWYLTDGPGGDRVVPGVVGTELAQADAGLAAQDLVTRTEDQFSDTVPAGTVISASPGPGASLKRGDEVTLVISKGVQTFEVPSLEGMDLDEATDAVEKSNLTLVEDDPTWSETVPEGEVISQSAESDALPEGGEVHVVLSQGREPIEVTDQRGRTQAQATADLKAAGLTVTISEAYSGDVTKGAVISQTPASGSVHRGDTVNLVISKGPEMVTVPDVFKLDEDAATAKLEKAGFTVKVKYDKGEPVLGLVYEQSVTAGDEAAKGSTVTITVF